MNSADSDMPKENDSPSRRRFLHGLVRYPLLLLTLVVGGRALAGKDGRLTRSLCLRARRCGGCSLVDDCSLPAAKLARHPTP